MAMSDENMRKAFVQIEALQRNMGVEFPTKITAFIAGFAHHVNTLPPEEQELTIKAFNNLVTGMLEHFRNEENR
jgi:hypothetical protein